MQSPRLMRAMFSTVAPRYDFITRAFSYGMDCHWKRTGLDCANLPDRPVVLDLASGTGDFSPMVRQRYPGSRAVAVDITERMLQLARARGVRHTVCGDAGMLPFPDHSFECVTRPGGSLVSLDFYLPSNALMRPLYLAYLYAQGTFWGLVLHGHPRVYTYIPDSLRTFVSIDAFSALLHRTGYHQVAARRYVLGGIGLHWAVAG